MIRAASFGDMPQGPYATEAELLAALTAWAGDPTTDGGAFSIAERGERLLPGNAKRGATRRVRCDRAGKPRSNGKSRENTLSKKCNCPWEVWIEEAKEGWVTSVFTKTARERALEMRAYSIHEIHKHPLLDTAVAPAVRLKRRKDNDDSEEVTKFVEEAEDAEGKQKVVNRRSMQEILDEREILMKGGEKPSIRNGGKPVEDEQLKKAQASWERKARRLAISHYYVNILGSPSPEKWKKGKGRGNDGTIGTIQKALKIPHGQRKLIENVLQEVRRCHEKGVEYTGERAQHSGTLGRPVLIATDSEDAKVIAQAYQDGVSVKKTVLLVNQQRKERDGEDATQTTEAAVYSCLNRLKEESLARTKINSRNKSSSRVGSHNRPMASSKDKPSTANNDSGTNHPFGQEFAQSAEERNQDIECPPKQNQNPVDDDTEQMHESISAQNSAQKKQDAKAWNDLITALHNRGYECSSVDEIVETFVAGKRHMGEDTAARKRHRVEANDSESNPLLGGLSQPSNSEGLGEGPLLAAASGFARATYDSSKMNES